jgi:hypothetical protein
LELNQEVALLPPHSVILNRQLLLGPQQTLQAVAFIL